MPIATCPNCSTRIRYPAELTDPFLHCTVCDEHFPRPAAPHDSQPQRASPSRAGQAFARHAPPVKGAEPAPAHPPEPAAAPEPAAESAPVSPPLLGSTAPAPADEPVHEPDPWYYAVAQLFAYLLAVIGLLATLILFFTSLANAHAARGEGPVAAAERARLVNSAFVLLLVGCFLSLVLPALLLIFADIGKTLRRIARQQR